MKAFGPFRIDLLEQCLWRGDNRITLTPKVFSVLHYLVDRPGRLVTQDELLEAIWPETYVQPEVLRTYIQDLRKTLGDRPKNPYYIETIPKRGYRFIAAVNGEAPKEVTSAHGLVGRDRELAELRGYLSAALAGTRQVVYVTGEAGIGKSTLLDEFEAWASSHQHLQVARGQCVEGFGGKEAYYPVLDALGQMLRGSEADRLVPLLALHAPTWLIQFPSLLKDAQRADLQREILGATRERMVREFCQVLEIMTAEHPLVLILEDLHWVDASTLDLISALARRRGPAKLLLLGTYRPVEVILLQSPLKALKQDLVLHKLCFEVVLERLTEADVAHYLARKFSGSPVPEGLTALIHRQSEGNPLFMAAIVADLQKNEKLTQAGGVWRLAGPLEEIMPDVPDTLHQMIEAQLDRLNEDEQRVLKSASVAGRRFSAWAVASMLKMGVADAEEICQRFAHRQQFLRPARGAGALGGSLSAIYEFQHALYRKVLYQQIAPAQRARLHLTLAESAEGILEVSGKDAVLEMASELALHFENGREFERAARYSILSAGNAAGRYAHHDAIATLEHALGLLAGVHHDAASAIEIEILEGLSDAHYALGDIDASAQTDQRVIAIAHQRGLQVAEVNALTRLARVYAFSDPDACVTVCEQAVDVCRKLTDPLLLARTELLAACWRIVNNGWNQADSDICASARRRISELQGPGLPAYYEVLYAHVQWIQGDYADAYAIARAGVEKAVETHSLVVYLSSLSSMALALMRLGRWGEMRRTLQTGRELSEKNGHELWRGIFEAMLGWLHIHAFDFEEGISIAESLLGRFREEPPGQVQLMALLTIGFEEGAVGDENRAVDCLVRVRDRQPAPKAFLQWYWRLISQFGMVAAYLKRNDLEEASAAADQFLADVFTVADPVMRAPAWEAVARVAARKGDQQRATECIERALSCFESLDLPSVAWRIHATAAEIQVRLGDKEAAERHLKLAAASLRQLAASFPPGDHLYQTLMAAAARLQVS